jgi:hypothetical protein
MTAILGRLKFNGSCPVFRGIFHNRNYVHCLNNKDTIFDVGNFEVTISKIRFQKMAHLPVLADNFEHRLIFSMRRFMPSLVRTSLILKISFKIIQILNVFLRIILTCYSTLPINSRQ